MKIRVLTLKLPVSGLVLEEILKTVRECYGETPAVAQRSDGLGVYVDNWNRVVVRER